MKSRKKLLIIIIIAAVVIAAALVFLLTHKSGSNDSSIYVQSVSSVNYAGTSVSNRYSGVVETQKKQKAEFDTTKKLNEILVSEGDRVQAGDRLFTYDTQSLSLDLQQKQLEIEMLETNISDNNTQISALNSSMASAGTSDRLAYTAQIQQLQASNAQSEYDIKTKKAELEKLQVSIDKAYVCAEMNGTVESIGDIDAIMSGTATTESGAIDNTLVTIVGDGDFRIKGKISELNIYELNTDMAVIVRSRINDQTWTGTVSAIETTPVEDSSSTYYYGDTSNESASFYPFYVALDSIDGLMLGQHVTVEAAGDTDSTRTGIWLDGSWFVWEDEDVYVWATSSADGRIEKRKITLGEFDEELYIYEIIDGLSEEDYIAWPSDTIVSGSRCTTEYVDYSEDYDDTLLDSEV